MAYPYDNDPNAPTDHYPALRRRALGDVNDAPVQTVDPYKGNWLAETARSTVADMENNITAGVPLLYHKLTGNQAGADENVQQYQAQDARARALGPEIQSFEDAERAGGGLWNYAKALGYQGAAFVPDTAAALVSGGTAGAASLATKQAVSGIARRVATNAIENNAENQARRELMESTVRRQFGGKVVDEDAVSDAVRQAVGIENKYIRREAMAQVAAQAGRTPRALDKLPAVGTRVGMAAGYFPSALGESVELLSDPNTTQGDAAVLGAGAAVGAALNLLPMERVFNRIGSDAAEQTVHKFLPRVGSEMAKQGFLEAGQEVAQTATTLASHAIVKEDPTVLFDEKAREQYLMSALAGGIFGAGMGGGVEVSRSAAHGIKDVTGKVYNSMRDYVRDGMHRLAERQRARREALAADRAPMAESTEIGEKQKTGGVSESLAARFNDIKARMKDAYTQGRDAASSQIETLFNDQLEEKRRNDVAERVAARIDNGEMLRIAHPARALDANPVAMDTPLQSHLMTFLRDDSPVWQQPETARALGQTLERIAQGEAISDEELAAAGDLGQMGDYDAEALAELVMGYDNRVKLNSLGAAQPGATLDETLSNLHRDLSPGEAAEFEAQQRTRLTDSDDVDISAAASGDTINGGLTERSTSSAGQDPLGRLTPAEQLVSAQRGVQAANKHARRGAQAALDNTALLSERAGADAATQALAATHNRAEAIGAAREARTADATSRDAARDALRTQLLGPVAGKFEYGKNVVTAPVSTDGKPVIRSEAMQKAWAFFDEKAKQPGVVRLENGARAGKKEGVTLNDARLLDMGSVIARKISELSPNFGDDARSQKALKQAAMAEAYGDLVLAGIKADPESVNHGYIPFKSGGGYYVTKAEAEGIRAMLRGDKPVKRQVPAGPVDRKTAATRKETAKQREKALEREPLQPTIHGHVRVGQEEDLRDIAREGGGDFDDSGDFKQGPRKVPEGSHNPDAAIDGRRFIPTEGVVTDVNITSNPYEPLLIKVRRARADKTLTPRQRGQVLHNVGVEIGRTELAKDLENDTISPKRYAAEIKRLEDFDTGLARQYAKRALKGDFDHARIVERRARTEKADAIDTEEARIERELYPMSDNPNAEYRGWQAREKEAQKLDRAVEQTIANTPKEQQAELQMLDFKGTKVKQLAATLARNETSRLKKLDPRAVQPQVTAEMRKVIAAHVNADGTLKNTWLKAPNGKETELPPLQWVIVRTPSFKKWFGYDWERRASDAGRGGVSTVPGVDGSEGVGSGDGSHRRLAVLGLGVDVSSRRKVGGGNRVSSRGTNNVATGAIERLGSGENRRVNRDGRSDPTLKDTGGDGRPANIHPVTLEPKLFYHGTYADFEAFDLDHPNKKDNGWLGEGVYLYTNPKVSVFTARNTRHKHPKGAQLRVIPLFARGQNFLYVTNEQKHANSGISRADAKVLSIKLRNAGYDGVTTSAGLENAELMVLNPNDVKHASANQGGFNESDNIFQDRLEETLLDTSYTLLDEVGSSSERTHQAFEERVDNLFAGASARNEGVRVLDSSSVMTLLKRGDYAVSLAEKHVVNDGAVNHGLTASVVKELPFMLEDPVAVFEYPAPGSKDLSFISQSSDGRYWRVGVDVARSTPGVEGRQKGKQHVTVTTFELSDKTPLRQWTKEGALVYLNTKKAVVFNTRPNALKTAGAGAKHDGGTASAPASTADSRTLKPASNGGNSQGAKRNFLNSLPESSAEAKELGSQVYTQKRLAEHRRGLAEAKQRDDLLSGEATHDPAAERILKQGKFDKPTDGSNDEADLKLFNDLATELLMEAGFDDPVRVEALDTSDLRNGGDYSPKNLRIRLNMRPPGPERMESFLHEIGHHIVHATIAKHVGWKVVRNLDMEGSLNALRHHEPELHAALEKDFKGWQAKHGNLSPAPFFRGKRGERRIDDHARAFRPLTAPTLRGLRRLLGIS